MKPELRYYPVTLFKTAAEILGKLAYLGGFNPGAGPRTAEALLEDFAWDKVPAADIPIPEGLF